MNNSYAKAYTEVLEMLRHLPKAEYDKIPKSKIEFYNANKDKNYIYRFDETKPLKEQNISRKANAIIITLFRDYFANEVQKEKLSKILRNNEIKRQKEAELKFNYNDLFKNKTNNQVVEKNELVLYKENAFLNILRKIKKIFKK